MGDIRTEYNEPYIPNVINPNQWILNGRSQKWMNRRKSRGYKRYISIYDPTPFKLNTIFRAWFPGDYLSNNGSDGNTWQYLMFYKLILSTETVPANKTNLQNYTNSLNGEMIMNRLFDENQQCDNLLKVYNVFSLAGVSITISLLKPNTAYGNQNYQVYNTTQNFVITPFWGKTRYDDIPHPDTGRGQTLYEILCDNDFAVKFNPFILQNKVISRYFRCDFNSMGWGSAWNSVNELNKLPILFVISSDAKASYYGTSVIGVEFNFYVKFKDRNV